MIFIFMMMRFILRYQMYLAKGLMRVWLWLKRLHYLKFSREQKFKPNEILFEMNNDLTRNEPSWHIYNFYCWTI